jgi:hypothetical protein
MTLWCASLELAAASSLTITHSQSDWEASSESEEEKPLPAVTAAPPKKKGTLKAKLAEKEASKASKAAIKADADNEEYDSDEVLDPREKARRDKERELAADLAAAKELLGTASIGGAYEQHTKNACSRCTCRQAQRNSTLFCHLNPERKRISKSSPARSRTSSSSVIRAIPSIPSLLNTTSASLP